MLHFEIYQNKKYMESIVVYSLHLLNIEGEYIISYGESCLCFYNKNCLLYHKINVIYRFSHIL